MAILDFIKNRPQPQPATKTAPESAKAEPAKKDVAQVLSGADRAKVHDISERLKKATIHVQGNSLGTEGSSNAALLQKQNNQDKTQAAMSPTDRFAGQTALQQKARGWER